MKQRLKALLKMQLVNDSVDLFKKERNTCINKILLLNEMNDLLNKLLKEILAGELCGLINEIMIFIIYLIAVK